MKVNHAHIEVYGLRGLKGETTETPLLTSVGHVSCQDELALGTWQRIKQLLPWTRNPLYLESDNEETGESVFRNPANMREGVKIAIYGCSDLECFGYEPENCPFWS